ncbi:MAG TPA: FAD-dependent oxidoreductase, partial [Anaeromyxobacteraceae bacterium]|nr:FAD-dependent oxidoreductase [Anaeromyxobacteraceae bacterium]
GLAAAEALAAAGRSVLLAERDLVLGGRLRAGLDSHAARPAWPAEVARRVTSAGGEVATGATVVGLWHEGGSPLALLVAESPARTRVVRAPRIVVCTGGHARPPTFEGNDLPGVFSGRALALALAENGVLPGRRLAVLGSGPEAAVIADRFKGVGIEATRVEAPVVLARGRARVRELLLEDGSRLRCDAVAQGESPVPAPDLLRALGVGVDWDPVVEAFAPRVGEDGRTAVPGLLAAGEVARPVSAVAAVAWGRRAGEAALG